MKKRTLTLITVLVMLATLLASSAMAETTITFTGFAGSAAGFEARADEFMKTHPDINVDVLGVPAGSWGELIQNISINIAGGDIPDIADVASEGQRAFADSGIIVPVDDLLARDQEQLKETLDDIHPNLLNAMKIDGQTYGLPTVWNTMVIYYNKNVLAEAGLEAPTNDWTVDEFLEMCKAVCANNNGGENDKYGYAFSNGYFVTLVPWMLVHGGNVLNDDWNQSRLTDPETLSAMNMLYDMVHTYKVSPMLDAGFSDFDLFVQNKVAFIGAGMWQVNALKNAGFSVDEYDVVPFPKGVSNAQVMGIGAAPIFKDSPNKDAAWEFAKYLSSKEFQETFIVEDGWSTPAVKSAADKLAAKDFAPANAEIFYAAADNGVMVPAPAQYGLIEATLLREFGAAMADMKTMEEAMQAAHDEINAALAE